jgi:muconolactone delta-isomerase
MKYFATAKLNTRQAQSPGEWLKLLKAAREYQAACLEDGTLECGYLFADGSGGFGVVNADSHDQLMDIILAHPQNAFLDWEIIPACDTLASYDKFIRSLEQELG